MSLPSGRPVRIVAVCGAGNCDQPVWDLAKNTGVALAQKKMILLCGGLGGVMTAAAKGAKSAGGLTIGLLPGFDPEEANPFIDIPLATGLGHVRNALIARAAQAIIALPGGSGTLSEIALGLKMGKPVIGLMAWADIKGVKLTSTPEEAVAAVCASLLTNDCPGVAQEYI